MKLLGQLIKNLINPEYNVINADPAGHIGQIGAGGVWQPQQSGGELTALTSQSSVTHNNITVTFDSAQEVGYFVTGDPFVVMSGSFQIVSQSPSWDGTRHGAQLNPASGAYQAWDARDDRYSAAQRLTFPYSPSANDSILLTRSNDTSGYWPGQVQGSNGSYTDDIFVLTVLSANVPNNSFRPCPSDTGKTIYNVSDLNTSVLGNIDTSSMTVSFIKPGYGWGGTEVGYLERGVERYWPMFGSDYFSRGYKPKNHCADDYWQQNGEFLSQVAVAINTDLRTDAMLYGFVQFLIDNFYAGNTDSTNWQHLYVMGGILLGDTNMLDYWVNNPAEVSPRDGEKFYWINNVTAPGFGTSSIIPVGERWHDYVGPTRASDGSHSAWRKQIGREYEQLAPSEWVCADGDGECKDQRYKADGEPSIMATFALAIIIMNENTTTDLIAKTRNGAAFAQADCWLYEGYDTEYLKLGTGRTHRQEVEYYHPGQDAGGTGLIGALCDDVAADHWVTPTGLE